MSTEHTNTELIPCPQCDVKLRIPSTDQQLKITCPSCKSVFFHNSPQRGSTASRNVIWGAIIIGVLFGLIWLAQIDQSDNGLRIQSDGINPPPASWISIDYGGLVDRAVLTHSGETVGTVISQRAGYHDEFKGLVQPYLERFSVLCHDALLSITGPDTIPLVNVLTHYPIGSEQPAWASLFREGHYQIYYSPNKIRVFIKGRDVIGSLENHRSVIRHPIRDILASSNTSIEVIEVYNFSNDYSSTEIALNSVPLRIPADKFDLSPNHRSIDLDGIEWFLDQGVILEAAEVDDNNDLYFYGKAATKQTIAGYPLSLADLAVIYRSIFHYGNNAPYISLDKNEDNRYAKVNFGGHLENTHVGQVVLEADKLFKTLSTGLDPNTHKVIKTRISKNVPDFLTEDERSLLESSNIGSTRIRYWFYPDSIGTVTDGSIGAVLTHQFLADVERMDTPVGVGNAVRHTIEHLNRSFQQYEEAFATFRELSNVGRMMALFNWLNGLEMNKRVELDEFLSVMIPAFETPARTKKMLAITAITYPEYKLTKSTVRNQSRVYYISDLLDRYDAETTDDRFLEVAGAYFDELDIDEIAPPYYTNLQSQIDQYDHLIDENNKKLESLEEQINRSELTVSRYSSSSLDRHNRMVADYNSLLIKQEGYINNYNAMVDKLNEMNIITNRMASIGGGINLGPKQFRRPYRSPDAPRIRQISSLKSQIRSVGKVSKSGNWIRSSISGEGARINTLPVNRWTVSKSLNGSRTYNYTFGTDDRLSVTLSTPTGGWNSEVHMLGSSDIVRYSEGAKSLQVRHDGTGVAGTGSVSANGKRIVFNK